MAAKGRVMHAAFRTFGRYHGTGPFPIRHNERLQKASGESLLLTDKLLRTCKRHNHRRRDR
jgi:hypothetical protein